MEAYCANEGLKNLQVLDKDIKFKKWYFNKVKCLEEQENYKFWQELKCKHYENAKVPVQQIVGTDHPNYHSKMWIELIGCLQRFSFNYWNKSLFYESCQRPGMYYSKFGDDYYITAGNHRSTAAKFLEIEFLEKPVTEYFFDQECFDIYREIKSFKIELELNRNYRNGKWIICLNAKNIFLKDFKYAKKFISFYRSIQVTPATWLRSRVINYFSDNERNLYINEERDFNLIKNDIIDHKMNLVQCL